MIVNRPVILVPPFFKLKYTIWDWHLINNDIQNNVAHFYVATEKALEMQFQHIL